MSLCIVCTAEFVCKVEKTICQVILASTASFAVSSSLISQTIIISGSCLRSDLSQFAKEKFILEFICIWLTQGILYSTGSSSVDILFSSALNWDNRENKVVDLPDPVGHTANIIP